MKRMGEYQSSPKRQRYRYFIEPILENFKKIKTVKARIHKIEISTNLLGSQLRDQLGIDLNIYPIDNKYTSKKGYLNQSHFTFKNLKVHLLTNPNFRSKNSKLRSSFLTIVPKKDYLPLRHKKDLLSLFIPINKGDLKIKSAELTFDFFSNDQSSISAVFDSLIKTIYMSHITKPIDINFKGYQSYNRNKLNRLIKFKDKYKLYERGKDIKRKTIKLDDNINTEVVKGWLQDDLDRVRFEWTLQRHELRTLKIVSPIDFINYKRADGINILHRLIDFPEFKFISVGERKYNYICLMAALTEMKRKHNYHHPIKRLNEIMLRRKMNRAVLTHSDNWFGNVKD